MKLYSNGIEKIALESCQYDDRASIASCALRNDLFAGLSWMYDADHCLDAPEYIPMGSAVAGIVTKATFTSLRFREWV